MIEFLEIIHIKFNIRKICNQIFINAWRNLNPDNP